MARGLRWKVREVPGGWTHPGWPGRTYKKPVAGKRYRLRVCLAVAGRPDQFGEFVMIARSYGNRDRWWIRPGALPGNRRERYVTSAVEGLWLLCRCWPPYTACSEPACSCCCAIPPPRWAWP